MRVSQCHWQIGEDIGSWPNNEASQDTMQPSSMSNRRLTSLGRMVMTTLYKCSSKGDFQEIPWVVSCRHGDTSRMVRLLSNLAEDELLSPTDFSMSVHNAIVGMFSIATKNRKMHTALAGAEASFEMGLLEALALQKTCKQTVGYIYYDSPLPLQYQDNCKQDCPQIGLALMLNGPVEEKVLNLTYQPGEKSNLNRRDNESIYFVDFLKNDEKYYEITVPGGRIHLESNCKAN